jgi:hypothetical protein
MYNHQNVLSLTLLLLGLLRLIILPIFGWSKKGLNMGYDKNISNESTIDDGDDDDSSNNSKCTELCSSSWC